MAAGPGVPGSGQHVPGSGHQEGCRSPVVPRGLPDAWRPLLRRPALAGLLGHPLADAALAELDRLLPADVALHSLRTFLLADARARARGTAYDRAGLLAAAAFHDAGLVGRAPLGRGGFTGRSAELLDRFLADRRVSAARRRELTRAVREHMRPFPARGAGPEARLLHFGAWLDVTGRGASRVPGERRRLAALAPTPWFAFSFCARVAACGPRRVLPGPAAAAR
ncbi:hypothetical protein [Streptomyces sp. CRN 30]|uniref:hypothetical protein n=1 Tax=Streptomyces sp. CRN 30 TaxID=3075613 RepID=UPI002A81995B|nr:hypothetical protein [Streptomyces sp. CRN 30]